MSADVVALGAGAYAVTIDGRREVVHVALTDDGYWASVRGEQFRHRDARPATTTRAGVATATGTALPITAPMPAKVRKVLVTPGAVVHKGATLVIVEAMKMELPLRASADGTVTAVHCAEGDMVQPDAVLVELS